MTAAGYALKNRAVMFVLILTVIAAGAFAYGKLGRLEDPEFTIKEAVVSTQYPGATAEQVELEVTEVLETAVQQLKQLKEVRSISRAGLSILFVEIQEQFDKHDLPQVWMNCDARSARQPVRCLRAVPRPWSTTISAMFTACCSRSPETDIRSMISKRWPRICVANCCCVRMWDASISGGCPRRSYI